ncbi:unnamed protein product [Bursaphelenchus okinawaensis]|uniref:Uncharacterized protein n=1 Tax=Bursaphelenchus okinawaensis TaxID=465554 RepID=A0A811LLQ9_9BILA|nr:unnamed protein product [Bursaphelenchus okinawaensis]CAG9124746.1 unnamed protein product [Bursaphelenchus okinawaensis]
MTPQIDPEPSPRYEAFEKWELEYMCCCRAVHVKQGSLMIGVVSAILILYSLLSLLLSSEKNSVYEYVQLMMLIFDMATVICLLEGVRRENHKMLLPYLIYMFQVSTVLLATCSFGIYIFLYPQNNYGYLASNMLFDSTQSNFKAVKVAGLFVMISCFIALLLTFWWAYVAKSLSDRPIRLYKCEDGRPTKDLKDSEKCYKGQDLYKSPKCLRYFDPGLDQAVGQGLSQRLGRKLGQEISQKSLTLSEKAKKRKHQAGYQLFRAFVVYKQTEADLKVNDHLSFVFVSG